MTENNNNKTFDFVGKIIDFENGELSDDETIELFQYLIDTGKAWTLQGYYGRYAMDLINNGLCKTKREPK